MAELKHIGPIIDRCIFDSWRMGDYLIAIQYGFLGGMLIVLYRGNEAIRTYPSDATHGVTLLYINAFIWAAENDAISSIPTEHFKLKKSRPKKYNITWNTFTLASEEYKLFHEQPGWDEWEAQFLSHKGKYVQELNEKLITQNMSAISKVVNERAGKELKEIKPNIPPQIEE